MPATTGMPTTMEMLAIAEMPATTVTPTTGGTPAAPGKHGNRQYCTVANSRVLESAQIKSHPDQKQIIQDPKQLNSQWVKN
jgi:hypothetical protein